MVTYLHLKIDNTQEGLKLHSGKKVTWIGWDYVGDGCFRLYYDTGGLRNILILLCSYDTNVSVTTAGLAYGKNLSSPANPRETTPHWYISSFGSLLQKIK